MKKKKSKIKWIALSAVLSGTAALVFVSMMYHYNYVQTESVISNFKQIVEQLHEDNGEQGDPFGGKHTVQEGELSDGYSSGRLNYHINKEALRRDSLHYNETLMQNQNLLLTGTNYTYAALDLTKYGIYDNIYGYVSAPTIGMELPIYLGANDDTMSYGAGHLCYTSLPTGGTDTNVVLAGHTGYIGRWLFDSVSSLSVGDEVSVTTYFGKIDYQVTHVLNRAPNDSDILFIEKGKDKLTLITCIDGGSARRVVVCER